MISSIQIRAYGLMRSGNHAVIGWVQQQHAGHSMCFLNNIVHGDADPFTNYAQRELVEIDPDTSTDELRGLKKHMLIFSYEDRMQLEETGKDFLTSVFDPAFETNREAYLGSSEHRFDLSIIRDPFNCIASRMKLISTRGPEGGMTDMMLVAENWKRQAREAIALEHTPQPRRIVAKYNAWLADPNYRMTLSNKLLGTYDDTSMRRETTYGGGSSFGEAIVQPLPLSRVASRWKKMLDPSKYRNVGHYAKRLTTRQVKTKQFSQRWKEYVDDATFRNIFTDPEVLELSESLFGETAETRSFVASL